MESTADHSTLNKLADATDGLYLAGIPSKVDAQIEELSTRVDTIEINGDNFAKEIYNRPLDLYAYPLTLALILLMIHLFLPLRSKAWHPLTALIALSFIFSPALKAAQYTDFDRALKEAKEEELPLAVIFTGSDWSPLSITFEKEILSHKVYQDWAKSKVITVLIDLPRTGIDKESRNARRALAAKFDITSYPMVIFLDIEENNLGSLSHDSKGAASWIKKANAILNGDSSVSDTAASIDYLPKAVKEQLENKDLTDTQRSIGYYNKGVEFERAEPDLELKSKDQFKLLVDLYSKAAEFSPVDRTDLLFKARLKLGLLHHRRGKSMVPNSQEEAMMKAMELQMEPVKMLEEALKSFRKGLALYKQAAPLEPANDELSTNFAVLYRDITRVQGYLDYLKAYQAAIETTLAAVTQEKRFLKSLEREVTTKEEINKAAINESSTAIDDLVKKALAIKEKPTLLPEEGLKDYKLALEDIVLAPPLTLTVISKPRHNIFKTPSTTSSTRSKCNHNRVRVTKRAMESPAKKVKVEKRKKKARAIDLTARMKVRATETRKAKNRRNPKTTPTYDAPAKKMATSAIVSSNASGIKIAIRGFPETKTIDLLP